MVNFEINNLSFSYPNEKSPTLKNISLKINQGEFVVICGKSGSGKSTLLRLLKPELSPKGKITGDIRFFEKENFSLRDSASNIGFMMQNTEYQAVTHCVRSELSFGLENLGLNSKTIRLRTAETAAYFSLSSIMDKKISELSGGQKQLVCLGSVVAMHPKAIILDEPTSQLDPVAAASFIDTAQKLCRENAITLIITEHRLEGIIPFCDRVIFMEKGEIISDCPPCEIKKELLRENEFISLSMPLPMRLYAKASTDKKMPLCISEGRKFLFELLGNNPKYKSTTKEKRNLSSSIAVEMKNVSFSYGDEYVLKNMNLKIKEGSFTALMGANGAGKTTALSLMGGILECKKGKIKLFGKDIKKYKPFSLYNETVASLPQKCESLFAASTIKEDLEAVAENGKLKKDEIEERIEQVAEFTEIKELLYKHPYDVSGGEMQKAALAMILLKEPKIILLDEPTKGMDNLFKKKLANKIYELCQRGITVIMVSHDTEFCGEYCDECAMIFDGQCVLQEDKYDFFAQNYFYTTSAHKISRDVFENAITQRQVLSLWKKNLQD